MKLSCPVCNGDRFVVFQRVEVSSVNTLSIFPLASQFLMTPDERNKTLVQCGDCAYKLSYDDIDRMNEGTYVVPESENKPQEEDAYKPPGVKEVAEVYGAPDIRDTTEALVGTAPETDVQKRMREEALKQ